MPNLMRALRTCEENGNVRVFPADATSVHCDKGEQFYHAIMRGESNMFVGDILDRMSECMLEALLINPNLINPLMHKVLIVCMNAIRRERNARRNR